MDREAEQATVHGVRKSQTRLKEVSTARTKKTQEFSNTQHKEQPCPEGRDSVPSRKQHLQSRDPYPAEEGCGSLDGKELYEMLGWQNLLEIRLLGALGRPVHRELLCFRTHCKPPEKLHREGPHRQQSTRKLPEAHGRELPGTRAAARCREKYLRCKSWPS